MSVARTNVSRLFKLVFILSLSPVFGAYAQFEITLNQEEQALMQLPEPEGQDFGIAGLMETPEAPAEFPGITTRVVDPYLTNSPNSLFLTSLPDKLWWDERAGTRLPLLVTEPVGLTRQSQPVSVFLKLPESVLPESLRVVTPYGREICSQARVVDPGNNEIEIVFVLSRLDAFAQLPLFIYYASEPFETGRLLPPDPTMRIEDRGPGIAIINSRFQVEFSREALQDNRYPLWRMIKGHGMEFNLISTYPTGGYDNHAYGVERGTPLQILEDGPVRKTVSYGEWGGGYTVSVYADSPLVCVSSASGLQSIGFWLPGGDTLNDVLAYSSPDGLKRMPINYTGGNVEPYTYYPKKWFKEGWFALLNEKRNEGVGWFFDLEPAGLWVQTVAYGYWVSLRSPDHSALYIARDSKTESCRTEYIAWKCPPVVSLGNPQQFEKIEPEVPKFGEDFMRMHILHSRFYPRENENSARDYVREVEYLGGNYLMYCASGYSYLKPGTDADGNPRPAFFDELVRECHARGMGMCHGLGTGLSLPNIREMVRRGVDAIWLADEWGWSPGGYYPLNENQRKQFLDGTWDWSHSEFSEEERADFKERYGADMPDTPKPGDEKDELDELLSLIADEPKTEGIMDKPELIENKSPFSGLSSTNLNDPGQLAMFKMLIDSYNLLMDDVAGVAREINTNVFITATTSPNNLVISSDMGAFHDLETLADSFSSVAMDLYSNDAGWLNRMIKYSRGAQGNRRPLFKIGGYSGWDNRLWVEINLNFHVMFGANGLCYFALARLCSPWPALGAKDAYDMLDYTGFGEFAAKAWPMEFVGVLRDRAEFFASLERGETLNLQGGGSLYEHSVFHYLRLLGFSIPANIIAAKHLESELQLPYKVVMVPNNPTISDVNAGLLREYVENGGNLFIECATIRNPLMAELAGVLPSGDTVLGAFELSGVKPPLEGWSARLNSSWMPSLNPRQPFTIGEGTEVLAVMGDEKAPGITMTRVGKGRVFYFPARIGPNDPDGKMAPMLRKLVEYVAGYLPVKVGPPGTHTWSTVLTDGEQYAICVFNDSNDHAAISLELSGFPDDFKTLTSIRTGISYPVIKGQAHNLRVDSRKTDYFMTNWKHQPVAKQQTGRAIGESLNPGMSFLNLPEETSAE